MEYTTQMDAARKGIFTPEMAKVAEKEQGYHLGYDVSTNLVQQPHAFARNWHQPIPDWRTGKNVQYHKE